MTEINETATPAEVYTHENTARASERFSDVLPATYDDKDDMEGLREQLAKRKKPIYAGLAFLCVVVIGVSIGVTTSSGTDASTSSGYVAPTDAPVTVAPAPSSAEDAAATAGVHAADVSSAAGSSAGSAPGSSHAGSVAGEASLEEAVLASNTTTPEATTPAPTTPAPTTAAPTPAPTTGPILPFKALDFDWKNPALWEYASGRGVGGDVITQDGIKLTPANSAEPIRTKQGWGGEKIVYIEWERSSTSDTNIWMLNTKLGKQFAQGNGWPYWGELDIFEMFTQDQKDKPNYDFSGFGGFRDVASYGQMTFHNGPAWPAQPCFCPSAPAKSVWYQNTSPMTSGCTAQFANSPKNAIATIWGSDGNGKYIQLMQNPTITKGGMVNGAQTYDITPGGGAVTSKIYNNKDLFWGTPASSPCAAAGGHNPSTGFPFFEDFRLILEEQKKGDGSAWFKVNNIQIFKK